MKNKGAQEQRYAAAKQRRADRNKVRRGINMWFSNIITKGYAPGASDEDKERAGRLETQFKQRQQRIAKKHHTKKERPDASNSQV